MVTVGVSEYFWWKIMVRAGGVISSKSGSPPSRPRWPLHLPRDARAASAAIRRSMHSAESPAARPCTLQLALTWLLHACKNTHGACVRKSRKRGARVARRRCCARCRLRHPRHKSQGGAHAKPPGSIGHPQHAPAPPTRALARLHAPWNSKSSSSRKSNLEIQLEGGVQRRGPSRG